MTKASHNTFTYFSPRQWYLKPFAFIAKCQGKTLFQQIREGITVFDLRLRQSRHGGWIIAHNAFIYGNEDDIYSCLAYLDSEAKYSEKPIYVRILHEVRNKEQAAYSSSQQFDLFCGVLARFYPNIKFFGGQRTMDWQQDHVFPAENDIVYIERHASVMWPKWLHWCPWIYAKLYNKANDRLLQDKEIVVYQDFI